MAPKKPNPKENPPAISSEEEEVGSSTEAEVETSSDDEEESEKPSSTPPQKPSQSLTNSASQPEHSSSEETGSESGSESDSEPDTPNPKPIASKPMEEPAKPRSQPASKRPIEADGSQKDSKRAKKKDLDEEDIKKPKEDTKKQRLWSEDDEIALLKGMIEFSTKKGVDPGQDMTAFHDFIKKLLHVDVTRAQLMDKIRKLKKKYEANHEVWAFPKPHDRKVFDLSKKVWGGESAIESPAAQSNGKPIKNQGSRPNTKALAALKADLLDGGAKGGDNDKECSLVKSVNEKEKVEAKVLFDMSLGVDGMEDYVMNKGFGLIDGAKKAELQERWKKLQATQVKLFVERNDLMKEHAKLVLEATKPSK